MTGCVGGCSHHWLIDEVSRAHDDRVHARCLRCSATTTFPAFVDVDPEGWGAGTSQVAHHRAPVYKLELDGVVGYGRPWYDSPEPLAAPR